MDNHRELQPAEPIGKQVSRMLFELAGRLRAHLDRVAEAAELTPMQARALLHLEDACPMGDVATRLHCDASNITGIVDRLEERGLVGRQQDHQDRRRKLLVLTEAGVAMRQLMLARMLQDHPLLRGLDASQLEALRDLLATALAAPGPAASAEDAGNDLLPAG